MLHRIRNCFGINDNQGLDNEVEIDETYIGGKNKNRHKSKKIQESQGRSTKDKAPVLGMAHRQEKVIVKKVEDVKSATLTKEIVNHVKKTAQLYTDEWLVEYKKTKNTMIVLG
jgi:hypothetical protein